MIKYTINKLYFFFDGITTTSVNYVSWTSAVVAALLALTTIIFSQYNERQITKSNDISRKIKESFTRDSTPTTETIIEMVKELIYVVSNQSVYKWTLRFFFIISYLSCLTWIISGIGYILIEEKLSSGDLMVIMFSLITVVSTFGMLPIILIKFNNKPPIHIDNKNRVSYDGFIKYFKSITPVSTDDLIKSYIAPSIEISLSQTNIMTIALKQQVAITNISYVFKFVGNDNQIQIICINSKKNETYVEHSIKSMNKNENSFLGLFTILSNSRHQQLFIFSKDNKNLLATFKMLPSQKTSNLYNLNINSSLQLSPDNQIYTVLKSKFRFKFQTFSSSVVKSKYRLTLKK